MRTLKTIREDLKAIRGYYSMKKIIDEAEQTVGVSLYVRNQTQNSLAHELYYSTNNIYCMNNKLLQYLQTKF